MPRDDPDKVAIHLTGDEALVLFELLSRWIGDEQEPTPEDGCFKSTSECAVLHGIAADLERTLASPFRDDYAGIVERARDKLGHRWKGRSLRT